MGDVPLIGPDGKPYVIDSSELDSALRQGFKQPIEPEEQEPGLVNALGRATDVAGTTATGALQGITGGLFGAALGKSDSASEAAQVYEAGARAHPIAHGLGEVAGTLVSPINEIAPGIEGAIAPETAVGRIGAKALGGAGTVSLFGAGNALSEEMLGDGQLNAEKLIAGAGLGAVLGGVGGGLGGVLGEGLNAIKGSESLEELANNRALKAAGAIQKDLKKLTPEEQQAIGQMLLDRGHVKMGSTAADSLESIEKDMEEQGQRIGGHIKVADAVAKPDFLGMQQRLSDFGGSLNPLERNAIAPDLKATSEALTELEAKGAGFGDLNDIKGTLQAKAKWTPNEDSVAGGMKRQLAGVFRDELDSQIAPALGSDAAKDFVDAKTLYGQLAKAQRFAQGAADRSLGNRAVSLTDYITGAGITGLVGGPHGLAGGVLGAMANRVLREHGSSIIASLANKLAESPALSAVAEGFSKRLAAVAPQLGDYAPMLMSAAANAPAEALATHLVYANASDDYREKAMMAGFPPELPEHTGPQLAKAGSLAALGGQLKGIDGKIDAHIDAMLRGGGSFKSPSDVLGSQDFGAKRMRRDDEAAHAQRVDEVQRLASDPAALADRLAKNGGVGHVAPGIAAAQAETASGVVSFLSAKAQHPLPAGPLAPPWMFSDAERHQFLEALGVAQAPLSVLKHAQAGTMTPGQVQALKAMYPKLAEDISTRALAKLSGRDVPYRQRLMLGLLTGTDVDGTMSGMAIARNQAAIKGPSQKPSNSMGGGKAAGKGSQALTLAQRTATPSEARDME